jgi:hypothetical protein
MRYVHLKMLDFKYKKHIILLWLLLAFVSFPAISQITVYPIQNFNFGTFYPGNSGGTINILPDGSRSATGDIILINTFFTSSQATFDIEAPAGSVISLSSPDTILTGSNGGTLTLKMGNTDLGLTFNTTAVPPNRTRIQIGGSLIVGDHVSSPPGNYQGTFSLTFNQQ